jgi:hypothetical protein
MTLHQNDVQLFAKASIDTFNLDQFPSINMETALGYLKEDINSEFNDLNSIGTLKARHEYFKVAGTTPSDYSEKILDLGDGKK